MPDDRRLPPGDVESLIAQAALRERTARRRAILYILIPIAAAMVLVTVTGLQVSTARRNLAAARDSLDDVDSLLMSKVNEYQNAQARVDSLRAYSRTLTSAIDSLAPRAAAAVQRTAVAQATEAKGTPRVFVHIMDRSQNPLADSMARKLVAAGYRIPGVQLVGRGPSSSQIRFFHAGERAEAESIASLMSQIGFTFAVTDLSRNYAAGAVAPRQFEIWFTLSK